MYTHLYVLYIRMYFRKHIKCTYVDTYVHLHPPSVGWKVRTTSCFSAQHVMLPLGLFLKRESLLLLHQSLLCLPHLLLILRQFLPDMFVLHGQTHEVFFLSIVVEDVYLRTKYPKKRYIIFTYVSTYICTYAHIICENYNYANICTYICM